MAKIIFGIQPDNIQVFNYFIEAGLGENQGWGIVGIIVKETHSYQALEETLMLTSEIWDFKDGFDEHKQWVDTKFGKQNLKPQYYLTQ